MDADGKLVSTRIFKSSGHPELDDAALKVARANKYNAGTTEAGKKKKLSCVKFKVKFVLKDDKSPVTEQATAETPATEPSPLEPSPPAAPGESR